MFQGPFCHEWRQSLCFLLLRGSPQNRPLFPGQKSSSEPQQPRSLKESITYSYVSLFSVFCFVLFEIQCKQFVLSVTKVSHRVAVLCVDRKVDHFSEA